MDATGALAVSALAGGGLGFLGGWGVRGRMRRREQQNLASALVGELVGLVRAIEDGELERTDPPVTLSVFPLPPFVVYGANANRLDYFDAPLARKITYFYTRLAWLRASSEALAPTPDAGARRDTGVGRPRVIADELKDVLDLCDDILRQLRPLLSRRHFRFQLCREPVSTAPISSKSVCPHWPR